MAKAVESTPIKKKSRFGKKAKGFIGWIIQIVLVVILSAVVAYGFFSSCFFHIPILSPVCSVNANRDN